MNYISNRKITLRPHKVLVEHISSRYSLVCFSLKSVSTVSLGHKNKTKARGEVSQVRKFNVLKTKTQFMSTLLTMY